MECVGCPAVARGWDRKREIGHESQSIFAVGVLERDERVVGQSSELRRPGRVEDCRIDRAETARGHQHERAAEMGPIARRDAHPQFRHSRGQRGGLSADEHGSGDLVSPWLDSRDAVGVAVCHPNASRIRRQCRRPAADRDRRTHSKRARIDSGNRGVEAVRNPQRATLDRQRNRSVAHANAPNRASGRRVQLLDRVAVVRGYPYRPACDRDRARLHIQRNRSRERSARGIDREQLTSGRVRYPQAVLPESECAWA